MPTTNKLVSTEVDMHDGSKAYVEVSAYIRVGDNYVLDDDVLERVLMDAAVDLALNTASSVPHPVIDAEVVSEDDTESLPTNEAAAKDQ